MERLARRTPKFEQRINQSLNKKPSPPTEEHKALSSFLLWIGPRDYDVWELALKLGFDPNWAGWEKNDTALHRIGKFLFPDKPEEEPGARSADLVKLFLSYGADPSLVNANGETPYKLFVRSGKSEIADLLLAHGANPDSAGDADRIVGAWQRMDAPAIHAIVEKNPASMNSLTDKDLGHIFFSIPNLNPPKRLERLRFMAEMGAPLGIYGKAGATPLHLAAWQGQADIVRTLLEFQAPVDAPDLTYGVSPLAWAAHGSANCRDADDDYCSIVEMLRAAGADLNSATNRWNLSPIRYASPRVAELLARWS
jgi:hypothetical protein